MKRQLLKISFILFVSQLFGELSSPQLELSFFIEKPANAEMMRQIHFLNSFFESNFASPGLSEENAQALQRWSLELISSQKGLIKDDLQEALRFALITSKLGQTKEAVQRASLFGIKEQDSEDFCREVMNQCPYIFPSFSRLNAKQQGLVKAIANMPSFHRVLRLQGDEVQFFETIKNANRVQPDLNCFELKLFIFICQLSTYADADHKQLWALREICLQMSSLEPIQAFTLFEKKKAQWLGFTLEDPYDRLLTSLGTWLGLTSIQEGKRLKRELANLDPLQLEKIIESHEKMRKEGKTYSGISDLLSALPLIEEKKGND